MVSSIRLRHGLATLALTASALGLSTSSVHAQSFPPPTLPPPNLLLPGAVFTVTTNQDPGDGTCDVSCSLRDAIVAANSHVRLNGMAPDQIIFRIPLDQTLDITLQSALPTLTNTGIVVDGSNQPTTVTVNIGGRPTNITWPHPGTIALHGSASAVTGLSVSGAATIRDLEFSGFSNTAIGVGGTANAKFLDSLDVHDNGTGVTLDGSRATVSNSTLSNNATGLLVGGSNHVVSGNTITNNLTEGVLVTGANDTIGGSTVSARNVISGNGRDGVRLAGSTSGIRVAGNFIGVDATGNAAQSNAGAGVNLNPNTQPQTIENNVISANGGAGVIVFLASAPGTPANVTIQNNLIGTNASGTAALGNGQSGVDLEGSTQSGLDDLSLRVQVLGNVISGNLQNGVFALGGAHHTIQSNMIGTDATGTLSLGNGRQGRFHGVAIQDGRSIIIGGDNPSVGNVIANNANTGVIVFTTTGTQSLTSVGNTIRQNRVFANGRLGIDLATVAEVGFGTVTPNDPGDADNGANRRQNFPVLLNAVRQADGTVVIVGTLDSQPLAGYALDFYSAASCDQVGNGEGSDVVGTTTIATGNASVIPFTFHSSAALASSATVVTATATRTSTGDTSEFSACMPIN